MIVVLKDGYFVDVDPMNFTLKKTCPGTRKGEACEVEKNCGYFKKLDGALEKFIKLMRIDGKDDVVIEFEEYLNRVRELDEKNRVFLEGFMNGVRFEKG